MYAIIKTGGKQYRVQQGDVITIEKLNAQAGDTVTFDEVLAIGEGANIEVGTPFVSKSVTGKVVENGKGKKVIIFKYKAKKNYRKKQGHRQPYTMVEITSIGGAVSETKPVDTKEEVVADNSVKTPSMSMKKDELIAFAEKNNIEVDAKATKQVILDTINENLK